MRIHGHYKTSLHDSSAWALKANVIRDLQAQSQSNPSNLVFSLLTITRLLSAHFFCTFGLHTLHSLPLHIIAVMPGLIRNKLAGEDGGRFTFQDKPSLRRVQWALHRSKLCILLILSWDFIIGGCFLLLKILFWYQINISVLIFFCIKLCTLLLRRCLFLQEANLMLKLSYYFYCLGVFCIIIILRRTSLDVHAI